MIKIILLLREYTIYHTQRKKNHDFIMIVASKNYSY